jgi:MFS family permease
MTEIAIETTKESRISLLNGWLLLFMFAMILANIGGNMYFPILPLYLQDLNATVQQVGLFFTLSRIIPLALQILGGWMSDTLGRLRSIAIGSIGGMIGFVFMLVAPTWQWLLVAMAFGAVSGALVGPSFDAFIAENSDESNRARVFGITQSLFMIVAVIGPFLGGWLADDYSFRFMLLVAALLYLGATIIRIGMARRARESEEKKAEKLNFLGLKANLGAVFGMVFSGGIITWIMITDGVRDTAFALSDNLTSLYMGDVAGMSMKQIGLVNSLFGLFMMLFTYPGGWLADKKGERIGIAAGFGLIGLSFFVFLLNKATVWMFGFSWALAGIGAGLLSPAYSSLISKAVPEKLRGTAFGLFSTSLGLISLPAPALGALLWDSFNPRFPFIVTAAVVLATIIPAWVKFKLPQVQE